VAGFIRALQRCDAAGGPPGGEHSWFRGCSPAHYDDQARTDLATLGAHIDTARAAEVWAAALAAEWRGDPVWFHGDIAPGNLLVVDGKLAAVIDFGTAGVGDPACDLVIAWTMFATEDGSREAFREAVAQDAGTWARARGWALWKAMLMLGGAVRAGDRAEAEENRHVINEVLADHAAQ
jgi:aminoglycoside phosphotransferase (APT) family kinase protein